MDRSREEPIRLKDLIAEVGARMGLRRPAAVGALWARWAEIAGDDIATNAEPTSLREGVLRIRTQSPGWATEIGYLGDAIASRVNEAMGSDLVREVRVWTGPEPIRPSPSQAPAGEGGKPATDGSAAVGERERRSPTEALEAARAAWTKRFGAGRSERRRGSGESRRAGR